MKYKLAEDAKPQVTLLLAATALSILLFGGLYFAIKMVGT